MTKDEIRREAIEVRKLCRQADERLARIMIWHHERFEQVSYAYTHLQGVIEAMTELANKVEAKAAGLEGSGVKG